MTEGFGARLRRRREEQGIALLTIAGHTKIKLSLLEGLERDDVSQWPSGIFRRAYIRSYAQAIGLDPQVVAGEFLETHPDPGEVVTTETIAATLDGARTSAAPPTRLRFIVGSALGSLARLRRTPEVVHVGAGHPASPIATRHEPDLPLAADPTPELWQIEPPETHLEQPVETEVEQLVETEVERPREARAGHLFEAELEQPLETHVEHLSETELEQPLEAEARAAAVDIAASTGLGLPDVAPPALDVAPPAPDVAAPAAERKQTDAPSHVVAISPAPLDPDFSAVAALCTELGRAGSPDAVQLSLRQAARILDATGLIVWLWDELADGLRPALVHGYADALVAQLPIVRCEADNATAAAFRSARTCAVDGGPDASGALALPLLTPDGCAGVLAIELPHGRAQMPPVRAAATIVTAQLATLAGRPWRHASEPEAEPRVPVDEALTSAGVRTR